MRHVEIGIQPNGCKHCGEIKERHLGLYHPVVLWHQWVEPTQQQRLIRMKNLYYNK